MNAKLGLILSVALLMRPPECVAQTTISELARPPHLQRISVVSENVFTEEGLKTIAESFIRSISADYYTATLWIITKEPDLVPLLGAMGTDQSYEQWKAAWDEAARASYPVCRVSMVGTSATLQARMRDGRRIRLILGASDPLRLRFAGRTYEVTYVFGRPLPESRAPAGLEGRTEYVVCLHANENAGVSPSAGLWRQVRSHFRAAALSLVVRQDFWFRTLAVAAAYPFADDDRHPPFDLLGYSKLPETEYSQERGGVRVYWTFSGRSKTTWYR